MSGRSQMSSAARSMTSSMTIPMANSGDTSATLSDDSYNDSSHLDDGNIEDITYISQVSFNKSSKIKISDWLISTFEFRLKIHQKLKLTKVKQLLM